MSDTQDGSPMPFDKHYAMILVEMCIKWNYIEDYLRLFARVALDCDEKKATAIISRFNNQGMIDLVEWVIESEAQPLLSSEHVTHFLRAFRILQENRNIMIHSSVRLSEPDIGLLVKNGKNKIGTTAMYRMTREVMEANLKQFDVVSRYANDLFIASMLPYARYAVELQNADHDNIVLLKPEPLPEKCEMPVRIESMRD